MLWLTEKRTYSKVCHSKSQNQHTKSYSNKSIKYAEKEEEISLPMYHVGDNKQHPCKVNITFNDKSITMEVDTEQKH